MANDGTDYEIFVAKLHQALLDSDTYGQQRTLKVETNKHIVDRNGIKRQFDVYWEYEIAGITYKTVIECKDYASAVTIEKIDALIGKVADIPGLKPVFATKTGYQSGAKTKAEIHNIELLLVREQNDSDWLDENGNPLIRKIIMNGTLRPSAQILSFDKILDKEHATANGYLDKDGVSTSFLNTEVSIEDNDSGETYTIRDLSARLTDKDKPTEVELIFKQKFNDAYLITPVNRYKLVGIIIKYILPAHIKTTSEFDYTKELVGVIEYLNQGTKNLIFKNGKIRKVPR